MTAKPGIDQDNTAQVSNLRVFRTETFVLVLWLISLFKLALFSAGVQAPDPGWPWRILGMLVFLGINGSILFLLLAPTNRLKSQKHRITYGLGVHLLVGVILLANRMYNLFFQSYISLDTLAHSGEGLSMIQALVSTIRFGEFLWIVDVPLLAWLFLRMEPERPPGDPQTPRRSAALRLGSMAACLLVLWTPVLALYFRGPQPGINAAMKETGALAYYLQDAVGRIPVVRRLPEAPLEQTRIAGWFESRRERQTTQEYRGLLEGRNVIFLQVEALQQVVIGKTINGREVTPNLNSLLEDSLWFDRCYDQVEMATADAEVLVNQSLYPLENVSVYLRYPENTYLGMPRILRDQGYAVAAFHGHERSFYSRDQIYPKLGFERYISRRNYQLDEVYGGLMGDRSFLEQTAAFIGRKQEPFFSFVITLTSHHPFNYLTEEDYDGIDVSGYEHSIVGDYIRSIHYVDDAVGRFVESLKEQGLMENTLLVIYGDHAAFNYNERDYRSLNRFFETDIRQPALRAGIHRVPVIFYAPGSGLEGRVSDPMGMIDIMPTAGNLLAVDTPFAMGRDVLNSAPEPVILGGGSFVTEQYYYSGKTGQLFFLETGEETDDERVPGWLAAVWETLDVSRLIYETDYFAGD